MEINRKEIEYEGEKMSEVLTQKKRKKKKHTWEPDSDDLPVEQEEKEFDIYDFVIIDHQGNLIQVVHLLNTIISLASSFYYMSISAFGNQMDTIT